MPWLCQEKTKPVSVSSTPSSAIGVTHGLCDVIDYNCAICISVVHGRQRFIPLLTCSIPYLKFDRSSVIQRYGLGEESSANS